MNLLSVENISKSYGDKILFNNLALGIEEGEKIGLLGVNGTGKTSLLKILAGIDSSDTGRVAVGNEVNIEYLPQNPVFDYETTVIQQVFKGDSPIMELLREYQQTTERIGHTPSDQDLGGKLVELHQRMDDLGAWQVENEAKAVLTRLGVSDFQARVGTLSGGQRKRVALASALISPSDILILDEPTNHIDDETVVWLEQYLNKRKGALLMVTHDRYFLDRVVNRVWELERSRLFIYTGNYSLFLEKKLEREEVEQASERKRQNLLRRELAWIRRGARARSTKQKARIERFESLESQEPQAGQGKVEVSMGSSRLGKKIIELDRVSKGYDGLQLIEEFSYIFTRNSRVGIVGPNGAGKSTLLKIVADQVQPEQGRVERGQTVKLGCFFQDNDDLDHELRAIEYVKEVAEFIPTSDGKLISAAQMMEMFLFPPILQWTPIKKLSGGEKRRLYLLRVLMGAPNVLLLDEPTNDLDVQTLTVLEEYLEDFPGVVITVSHDRYFLDKVTDRILAFIGKGKIVEYLGNYSDYLEEVRDVGWEAQRVNSQEKKDHREEKKKERRVKFSYKEQLEYDQIEGVIEDFEKHLLEIKGQIDGAASNFVLLQELMEKQKRLEGLLEEKMERWTYLSELAEEIAGGNS